MVEFRNCITSLDKTSYAQEKSTPVDTSGFMDCSNGINPFGMSKQVQNAFLDFDITELNTYPKPAISLKRVIKEYWDEVSEIDERQIILGDGSIELIYKINKLFIDDSSNVMGYSPQFSDFVDDVKANGGRYESYIMNGSNNFKMNPGKFINMMNKNHSMFYIDNPNNPTGQVINIEHLEKIVKHASDPYLEWSFPCSNLNSFSFISVPPPNPARSPLAPITLCQGIINATGFLLLAFPTAR